MRIGIDAHFVGIRPGGNEHFCKNVIKELAALETSREEYFVFNQNGAGSSMLPPSPLQVVPLRKKSVYLQRGLEIPLLSRRLALDVIHVPFNFLPVGRAKKVVTIYDLAFLHVGDTFDFMERKRMSLLTGFSARRADHIITTSEFSKQDIVRRYGVPEDRITVTQCAVDREAFRPWTPEAKQAFLSAQGIGSRFLLFVGTLQPRKNVLNLIKAFRKLPASAGDVQLIIVGRKGWIYEDIFRLIREESLESRVRHLEHVDQDTLTGLYNTAEAFVFPSLFEGFGMPILEAMSCGCPVASSDATCLPEAYGDAALSFHPEDIDAMVKAMVRILGDDALRKDLIEKGFRNCDRFSWQKTARIVRQVYRSL